jgi:tellurite resistance-related uncharacterized protein
VTSRSVEEEAGGLPWPAERLPAGLEAYRRTPEFSEESVPEGLLRDHSTKAGVWGLIRIVEGQLLYRVTDRRRAPTERLLDAGDRPGVVEPEILHKVEPTGRVRFFVEFFREP